MHTEPPAQPEAPDGHIEAARALLARAARDHAPVTLASSMSAEDMVLIDLVARGYGTLTWVFLVVVLTPLLTLGVWKLVRAAPDR